MLRLLSIALTLVMLAAPPLAGAGLGMSVPRPRLGWFGVVGVVAFLVFNAPIIDALKPDGCLGQLDCPDPSTDLFAYFVMVYALAAGSTGFAIGASRMRSRTETRLGCQADR